MEQSEHAFLRYLGWSVVESRDGHKISWPRVSARCDYFRPVRFEDVFGVQVQVARIGRTSCTYRFRFLDAIGVKNLVEPVHDPFGGWTAHRDWFDNAPTHVFAEGFVTAVCCRILPGHAPEPWEIPWDWREKLTQYCSVEEQP